MILKDTKLKNRLKKVQTENPEIKDIIIFGSVVKGKKKPADIDILVLFEKKVIKQTEYEIKKILEKEYDNISILSKTENTLLEQSFDARESILFEGKSLLTKESMSERYGFSSLGMFKYDFKDWTKLKKTKFYYALNGRGKNTGISDMLECVKLSDRIVLVPLENIEQFKEFLAIWELEYTYIPIMIPSRMNRKKILT